VGDFVWQKILSDKRLIAAGWYYANAPCVESRFIVEPSPTALSSQDASNAALLSEASNAGCPTTLFSIKPSGQSQTESAATLPESGSPIALTQILYMWSKAPFMQAFTMH